MHKFHKLKHETNMPNFYIQSEIKANTGSKELASILRASDNNKYAPPVHVMELQGDS